METNWLNRLHGFRLLMRSVKVSNSFHRMIVFRLVIVQAIVTPNYMGNAVLEFVVIAQLSTPEKLSKCAIQPPPTPPQFQDTLPHCFARNLPHYSSLPQIL